MFGYGVADDETVSARLQERLRVLESWGPHPIQPVVLGSNLADALGPRIAAALLEVSRDPEAGPALARLGLECCTPIDDELYAQERAVLEDLGQLRRRCTSTGPVGAD